MTDEKETTEKTDDQSEPSGLYEKMKAQDDGWELWAKLGVGLFGLQVLAYAVAYLPLGYPSVVAHSVAISMLGVLTIPLTFWGLLRALFVPPVLRLSRAIGFVLLLLVAFAGNSPMLSAPAPQADFVSEHEYRLPFHGEWSTLAGGESRTTNYHATTMVHRWGYDFAPVVDGERYTGDGSELEDHHCYGAPVLAPVAGEVVEARSGEADQAPGEQDSANVLGNYLIIEVDDAEYLFMAHLKEGSLEVGSGDEVEPGEPVAKCGNSGRTATPHLHVHLQNSREFPMAEGLPLRFSDYIADGEPVDEGMPLGTEDYLEDLGQIVEPM